MCVTCLTLDGGGLRLRHPTAETSPGFIAGREGRSSSWPSKSLGHRRRLVKRTACRDCGVLAVFATAARLSNDLRSCPGRRMLRTFPPPNPHRFGPPRRILSPFAAASRIATYNNAISAHRFGAAQFASGRHRTGLCSPNNTKCPHRAQIGIFDITQQASRRARLCEKLAAQKSSSAVGAVSALRTVWLRNGRGSDRGGLRPPLAVLFQAVAGDRACHIAAGRRGRGRLWERAAVVRQAQASAARSR